MALPPAISPSFQWLMGERRKSVKTHLVFVIKVNRLNLKELQTLLCQIEACVKARPMTPLNSDPCEPNSLTPAHFLVGVRDSTKLNSLLETLEVCTRFNANVLETLVLRVFAAASNPRTVVDLKKANINK